MLYLPVESVDPYFNMALEEYAFLHLGQGSELFFLWRNEPSVIIGKNQNAFEQVNPDVVEKEKIPVIRRMSGGGAVYHDLGNVNFSFIFNRSTDFDLDYRSYAAIIVASLGKLGIKASLNHRCDILVEGKKVSGNARYYGKNRILYHGTLLYSTDIEKLADILYVDNASMKFRGIKSVYSQVCNIGEYMENYIPVELFIEKMAENIKELMDCTLERYLLTKKDKEAIEALSLVKYRTWEWNYGYSPTFTKY